jgi:choline dehydrogenase-like flavoprotein
LAIILLEYGEFPGQAADLDGTIDVLNLTNHHPPQECTNKGLGGTSLTWGGRCVTYDEIDFLPHGPVTDQCTWNPEVFESAKSYYGVAARYFECGAPHFTLGTCFDKWAPIADRVQSGEVMDSCLERWSMPTRFGRTYGAEVKRRRNITLKCGACVTTVTRKPDGSTVVAGYEKSTREGLSVEAKHVVLAAGGHETTRILFNSPTLFGSTFPAALGRYYQGHISGKIASIKFSGDPVETDFGFQRHDGAYIRRRFQLTTELLLRESLLNTALWLDNPPYADPSHRNGTMSFIYLMMIMPISGKRLAPPAIAHSITKGGRAGLRLHLENIIKGMPRSMLEPAVIFAKRYIAKRKLPGVFLYNGRNEYALHFHAEQVPVRENYIMPSSDGSRLEVSYSYTDADVDSVIRTHKIIDRWLRDSNAGQLRFWYPDDELPGVIRSQSRDGLHQVGTTRISLREEEGVVDSNLELWRAKRVYICSSSAFPTSGQANPTFLLGAFAARLADRIASQ